MQTHCPPAHNEAHTQHIDWKEAGTQRVLFGYSAVNGWCMCVGCKAHYHNITSHAERPLFEANTV